MKRYPWPFTIAVLVGLILVGSGAAIGFGISHGPNSSPGQIHTNVTLSQVTRGIVFSDAAINANATIAACFSCTGVVHVGTGEYEVDFIHNVQANNGWSRWVQVDTLQTGTFSGVVCDTADRAGNVNGIYVQCQQGSTLTDVSFFLFIAR
jgi:hypothetical protein